MGKFNTIDKRHRATGGPITTSQTPNVRTYNGAQGYEYETLSQLFLLAVSNMVGEDTFYEKGDARDKRFTQLIHQAVAEGHVDWLSRFLPWLRNEANMRSAAVVGGVETVVAMGKNGITGGRRVINSVLARADEPGEALAYHHSAYGRSFPKPLKRGIADAVQRLYTEYSALKYDTASKGLRFGDVIEMVHPSAASMDQGDLFKFLLARGHKRDLVEYPATLPMIQANGLLRRDAAKRPELMLNTARLLQAGMTWEAAKSLVGGKVSDKDMWTCLIPAMGYMALLRNLRNFDEAGISTDTALVVQQRLMDPDQVAKSRQLPMRFWSAYRNVPSNRWAQPLEVALDHCLRSVPEFPGRTLILIDTSGSMNNRMSGKSELKRWDAAAIFGLAVAARCEDATVVSFSDTNKVFPKVKGESLLKGIDRFMRGFCIGSGTSTHLAVTRHYSGHDRLIVLTDEQADANHAGVFSSVPPNKMVITFNLAGYSRAHAASGPYRVTIGGLSDAAFHLLPALEGRAQGKWPF